MMTKLVAIADKNAFLHFVISVFVFVSTHIISVWNEVCATARVLFHFSFKYNLVKALKNKYKNKRCFIICTGPSLTIEDVEKLKKEYTFGMNSLCLLYDKTNFRPTFYGCIDKIVYDNFKKEIKKFCGRNTTVFISDRIKRKYNTPNGWITIPLNVAYHTYDRWFKHKYWSKFSDDCYRLAYDMYSVTHLLIQLATYMGFKEIYLLGADCTFQKNNNTHFIEYGTLDQDFDSAEERCIVGYDAVKEYMDTHKTVLYNATRGGKLEKFKRVNLDDVLGERKA